MNDFSNLSIEFNLGFDDELTAYLKKNGIFIIRISFENMIVETFKYRSLHEVIGKRKKHFNAFSKI